MGGLTIKENQKRLNQKLKFLQTVFSIFKLINTFMALLFKYNILAQRTRYSRSILLQNQVTILVNHVKSAHLGAFAPYKDIIQSLTSVRLT